MRNIDGRSSTDAKTRLQTALNRIVWDIHLDKIPQDLCYNQIEILKLSLKKGADPNIPFHKGFSAWAAALSRCHPTDVASANAWADIIEAMVRGRADPNAEILDVCAIRDDANDTHDWLSPLSIIRENFRPQGKSKLEDRRIKHISDRLQAQLLEAGGKYFTRQLESSMMTRRGFF